MASLQEIELREAELAKKEALRKAKSEHRASQKIREIVRRKAKKILSKESYNGAASSGQLQGKSSITTPQNGARLLIAHHPQMHEPSLSSGSGQMGLLSMGFTEYGNQTKRSRDRNDPTPGYEFPAAAAEESFSSNGDGKNDELSGVNVKISDENSNAKKSKKTKRETDLNAGVGGSSTGLNPGKMK